MKSLSRLTTIILLLLFLSFTAQAQNDMRYFITRAGDRLMEGAKEYRFISFNIPNLHLIEDNMAFEATNEWRFPDEFEINDALQSIKQMGGRVARIYVISICKKDGPNPIPCHVKKPGEFNEEAFRALDKVLEIANRTGVRVIIPLVDNWKWWGGAEQYAEYRGKPQEAFWTDPDIISDFKKTIQFVINRRNTITGTLYKDDKAILAWETGNELYSPYSWTKEIAADIKSLDHNHLVWDGFYIGNREIQEEALSDPNIDIVSSHHYPAPNRNMLEDIERFRRQIAGKKVYILGEVGFVPLDDIRKILDTVIQKNISGAMIWSLRYHNRDGGFYWHSEPSGGLLYKAYHYPGFATGEAYTEIELLRLMREKAFEIRGLAVPPIETPAPPVLLPFKSVDEISWRGSVGATAYDVERATARKGAWTVVGANIDDTRVQYRPLFADESAEPGRSYYYRVRAKNSAGTSAPSNTIGPLRVEVSTIVDELSDYARTFAHGGALALETSNPRPYKEDAHRLKGSADAFVTYRAPEALRSLKVLAFMENDGKDFEFYLSKDGKSFTRVEAKASRFPTAVNPYGYKLPVEYELSAIAPDNHFLKIVFRAEAQIGRVELRYGKAR